jgi:hypothetical protein
MLVEGHCFETVMPGIAQTVQVAEFVAHTDAGISALSVPHAVTVSLNGPHKFALGV